MKTGTTIVALLVFLSFPPDTRTEDLPGRRATVTETSSDEWAREISARRGKYLDWIIDEFGKIEQ